MKNNKPNGYFDYISFPDREKRDYIRKTFFDTQCLKIDEQSVSSIDITTSDFDKFDFTYKLRNKVLFFNNTVCYLELAILQMVNYFYLFDEKSDSEDLLCYSLLYRQSCRNVSCEIFIYEEKIKDIICLIIKHVNCLKKLDDKKLMSEFTKVCKNTPYRLIFLDAIKEYHKNENVVEIKNFRNNEVHNESNLFINYENNAQFNNYLFNKIQNCLFAMVKLKTCFESFLLSFVNEMTG